MGKVGKLKAWPSPPTDSIQQRSRRKRQPLPRPLTASPATMAFEPAPLAKRQRLGILDLRKPDLNPSAPEPPDLTTPPTSAPSDANPRRQSAAKEPNAKRKPRSAPSGNYQGYYERRKLARDEPDERLALIPLDWLKGKKVLDVGCNSGVVTVELAQRFGPAKAVGVDIDPGLIRQAKTFGASPSSSPCLITDSLCAAETAWSRQAPLERLIAEAREIERQHSSRSSQSPALPSVLSDAVGSPFVSDDPHHFPVSLPRMFGNLPQPRHLLTTVTNENGDSLPNEKRGKRRESSSMETRAFPENLQFVAADWVNERIEPDRDGYNVIIACVQHPQTSSSALYAHKLDLQLLRHKVDPLVRPESRPPDLLPALLRLPSTRRQAHPRASTVQHLRSQRQDDTRIAGELRSLEGRSGERMAGGGWGL